MSITEPGQPTTTLPDVVTIDGRRFHVVVQSVTIHVDIDTAWTELAGNFPHVHRIAPGITTSYTVPGHPGDGPGAARHCDLDFAGRKVSIKERIIDWIDTEAHKEFSYDVYESKGFPAKVYNTWRLRALGPSECELTTLFIVRMRPPVMTRPMLGTIGWSSRGALLAYKHFLETGTPATNARDLAARYR